MEMPPGRCLMCEAYEIKAGQFRDSLETIATLNEGLLDDLDDKTMEVEKWRALYESAETKYRLTLFALVCVVLWAVFHKG